MMTVKAGMLLQQALMAPEMASLAEVLVLLALVATVVPFLSVRGQAANHPTHPTRTFYPPLLPPTLYPQALVGGPPVHGPTPGSIITGVINLSQFAAPLFLQTPNLSFPPQCAIVYSLP